MVRLTRTSNRGLRSTLLIFPNTMRIIIPPFSGYGTVGGWRDSYLTVVPTDDETHLLFLTQQAHVPEEELDVYWETRRRYESNIAASRPITDIARDILAGKLKFSDVREHPLFLLIEDAVAQRGQGPIVDRTAEHLGGTDVCIVRLRRLFERELRALSEGAPLKHWRYDGTPPNRGF
jgi:5,5'-dehydrodivanillate O-demethylase